MSHQAELQALALKIQQIQQQAEHLDQQGKRDAYLSVALLDQRFTCRSDLFSDYVSELKQDYAYLERLSDKSDDRELLQVYCDRFVGKFASLQQQLSRQTRTRTHAAISPTKKVMQWQKKIQQVVSAGNRDELLLKLKQQRKFEQQLIEQIDSKKQQLRHSHPDTDTAKLAQQLLTLQSRLGECRKTTWKLEQRLAQI